MSYSVYLCQPFKRSVELLLKRFPRNTAKVIRPSACHSSPQPPKRRGGE